MIALASSKLRLLSRSTISMATAALASAPASRQAGIAAFIAVNSVCTSGCG
jgi:hypothetical protein